MFGEAGGQVYGTGRELAGAGLSVNPIVTTVNLLADSLMTGAKLITDWNGTISGWSTDTTALDDMNTKSKMVGPALGYLWQSVDEAAKAFQAPVSSLGKLVTQIGSLGSQLWENSSDQAKMNEAKTTRTVIDEKTGLAREEQIAEGDPMRGLSASDQRFVMQEAQLRSKIKKAEELKGNSNAVSEYAKFVGANESDFAGKSIEDIIKTNNDDLAGLEKAKVEARTSGNWLPNSMTGAGQDSAQYDAATMAVMEKMAKEATSPGSIYTHDTHLEKILVDILSVLSGQTVQQPGSVDQAKTEAMEAASSLPGQNNATTTPDIYKEFKDANDAFTKARSQISGNDQTAISGTPEAIKTYEEAKDRLAKAQEAIKQRGSSSPAQNIAQAQSVAAQLQDSTKQSSIKAKSQPRDISEFSEEELRARYKELKTKARKGQKLTNQEDSELSGSYNLMNTKANERKQAKREAAIKERTLRNKGKLGRTEEEEKEYQNILSNKPVSPYEIAQRQKKEAYQNAQKQKREAYLSRFRPEVRERMMTKAEKADRDAQIAKAEEARRQAEVQAREQKAMEDAKFVQDNRNLLGITDIADASSLEGTQDTKLVNEYMPGRRLPSGETSVASEDELTPEQRERYRKAKAKQDAFLAQRIKEKQQSNQVGQPLATTQQTPTSMPGVSSEGPVASPLPAVRPPDFVPGASSPTTASGPIPSSLPQDKVAQINNESCECKLLQEILNQFNKAAVGTAAPAPGPFITNSSTPTPAVRPQNLAPVSSNPTTASAPAPSTTAQTLTIDSSSLKSLNEFNTKFNDYVSRLEKLEFKPIEHKVEISAPGKHQAST